MWLTPAAQRPRDPEGQAQWLYDWWKQLDDWVEAQGDETAVGAAIAQGG
jgi:hypothetical protein